jgi:hypothetical protein
MRKVLAISLVLLVAIMMTAAIARAKEIERTVPMIDDPGRGVPMGRVFGVNAQGTDTFYYGGTVITGGTPYAASPGSAGWANRKMWSFGAGGFNGTPHSGLFMDGWKGIDNTAQTEKYWRMVDNATLGQNCVIGGSGRSLFVGLTNDQTKEFCYVDQVGTGYGNNWSQTIVSHGETFNSGDQVQIDYDYLNESEPGYDFTDVIVQYYDAIGLEWVNYDTMVTYTDLVSGHEVIDVDSYLASLTPPIDIRVRITFTADGGYSDEDGYFATTCGGFLMDNFRIIVNADTMFHNWDDVPIGTLPFPWEQIVAGCGDFAHVKHINDVAVPLSGDPCVAAIGPAWCEIQDSVLVFYDEGTPGYPHPLCQDNYAKSPVIDFAARTGLPGRILTCERFGSLPQTEYIFMYWQVRYKPGCESGGWSPWANDNYVYYTAEGTSCRPMTFDVSTFVPPEALQAQVGYGVINYCDEDPWGRHDCTYTCNHTPYYDNVAFGIYGSDVAPFISMRELDYFQDQFAEDGTLNKLSTADTRTANYLSNLLPPIFGDTLNCRGVADNMETWLEFRMAKVSPWQAVTHAFFTTWFPGVTGGGWQSARMDTTEVTNSAGTGTILVAGRYMSTFHESDVRALPELTEILPNNLFVPGTRVEYRVKSRYVGSGSWFSIPEAALAPEEFEILPMYVDDGEGGMEWAPLLVADHFGQRGNWFEANSYRIGRHLDSLDYHYDTFSKLGPTSDLRNGVGRMAVNVGQIGGPGTDKYNWGPGATLLQFLAYSHCMLNSGTQMNNSMNESDVSVVNSWLNLYSSTDRFKFFWASGDQLVRWLYNQAAWGRPFINNILGSTYVHKNYANQNTDYTYCLPLNVVAGGYLNGFTTAMYARSNGCTRTFNTLGVSGTTPLARAERKFDNQPPPPTPGGYASVANVVAVVGGANYKTMSEGYDNCVIRSVNTLGYPACGDDEVLTNWFGAVLTWANFSACHWATPVGIGDPNSAVPPAVHTSLANAYPNPMNPTATISYTVGTPGKVMLRVFDVSGRVIRTLVDEAKVTGRYSVIWDGSNDRGEKVASGVFFYQLNGPGYSGAKKIVILQ